MLGGLALIVGALTLIGTQIASQAAELSSNVVTGLDNLVTALQNSRLPLSSSLFSTEQWGARIEAFLTESQSSIAGYAAEVGARIGHFVAGLAITLFSLFYFLYDGRGIFAFLLRFFPAESRARVDHAASNGWRALAGYVRATILVALTDAVGVLIGALILGVPVAPALAALVFIGAFVPIVGAFVSGSVAVLVALVAMGWIKALLMLAVIILVVQVEGHILQPLLLGRAVKVHPLAVLLAIAVGVIVAGIVGALLAVPLLAFVKSFIQYLHGHPIPVSDEGRRRIGPRREDPDATGSGRGDRGPRQSGGGALRARRGPPGHLGEHQRRWRRAEAGRRPPRPPDGGPVAAQVRDGSSRGGWLRVRRRTAARPRGRSHEPVTGRGDQPQRAEPLAYVA